MKIRAPNGWRPSDENWYSFSRSSGLPHGYFDNHLSTLRGRVRWYLLALCVLAVIIL